MGHISILIDIDNVLADWNAAAKEVLVQNGFMPDKSFTPNRWFWVEEFIPYAEFIKLIDQQASFWEDLPVLPWADDLVNLCERFGNIYFVSSPGMFNHAASAKIRWLRRNGFVAPSESNFVITEKKYLLADRHTLLVDDSDKQCEEFEEAGGWAFLFPQPWNKNSVGTEMWTSQLEQGLAMFKASISGHHSKLAWD